MNAPVEAPLMPRMIDVSSIYPSPNITRITRSPEADALLAADIKRRGYLLQPITVRPKPHPTKAGLEYEVVFGHRRFGGAKTAELLQVQAYVRDLNDEETLELQVVENHQREKPDELGEAIAFKQLKEEHGWNADKIADKIKMSREQVYARMKLLELGEASKQALIDGKISASVALLIARVPEVLQQKALDLVVSQSPAGDVLSYRRANDLLKHRFTSELEEAIFDTNSVDLCPEAGSCTACPKRSGNDIFMSRDLESADICTDSACYEKKEAAHHVMVRTKAEQKGIKIFSGEEAKKMLSWSGAQQINGGEYKRLDAICYDDPDHREYRKILGDKVKVEAILENPHTEGEVIELMTDSAIDAFLTKSGLQDEWRKRRDADAAAKAERENKQKAKAQAKETDKQKAERLAKERKEKEDQRRVKVENTFRADLYQQIRLKVGNGFAERPILATAELTSIALNIYRTLEDELNTHVLVKMWGGKPSPGYPLEKTILNMDTPALCLFLVDLGLYHLADEIDLWELNQSKGKPSPLVAEAERLGIDHKAVRVQAEAAHPAISDASKTASTPSPAARATDSPAAARASDKVDPAKVKESQEKFAELAKAATASKPVKKTNPAPAKPAKGNEKPAAPAKAKAPATPKKPAQAKPAKADVKPAGQTKAKAPAKPKNPAPAKPAKEQKTESTPSIKTGPIPASAWPFPASK